MKCRQNLEDDGPIDKKFLSAGIGEIPDHSSFPLK
jgi:hypothetical protein